MGKDAYYFSHDSNARHDPKIIQLRLELGMLGYGIYWGIIEMLRESNHYILSANYKIIAYDLQENEEKIKKVVENYELFSFKKNEENSVTFFFSESLLQRMQVFEKTRLSRRKAGKKGGIAKAKQNSSKTLAKAKQNSSKVVAVKESKVKESKESRVVEIINDLNSTLSTKYSTKSKKTKDLIMSRLNEGFTVEDFKKVHRIKCNEWKGDPEMFKFLRPITLYSNKFESYLNQLEEPIYKTNNNKYSNEELNRQKELQEKRNKEHKKKIYLESKLQQLSEGKQQALRRLAEGSEQIKALSAIIPDNIKETMIQKIMRDMIEK